MSATKTPSLGRLIGRGAAWSGLNAVVLRLGSFVMGIVVARILDPTDFGIFAVALTVYGIVVNLSELGVSAALIREPKDVDELAPTVFTIALGSSSLLGLAMFVTAPMLAEMLGSAAAAPRCEFCRSPWCSPDSRHFPTHCSCGDSNRTSGSSSTAPRFLSPTDF